jgi:hypothetical protein
MVGIRPDARVSGIFDLVIQLLLLLREIGLTLR